MIPLLVECFLRSWSCRYCLPESVPQRTHPKHLWTLRGWCLCHRHHQWRLPLALPLQHYSFRIPFLLPWSTLCHHRCRLALCQCSARFVHPVLLLLASHPRQPCLLAHPYTRCQCPELVQVTMMLSRQWFHRWQKNSFRPPRPTEDFHRCSPHPDLLHHHLDYLHLHRLLLHSIQSYHWDPLLLHPQVASVHSPIYRFLLVDPNHHFVVFLPHPSILLVPLQ
mmetsp:Transcript_32663/g.79207  ORF Transcript_32663/g.79207 Transcript_32663/m.79207 type:complete len:222 (-) Transcript_32663:497-1162(-)